MAVAIVALLMVRTAGAEPHGADPVDLFDRVCLATMGEVVAVEEAVLSLGLAPQPVNDADPRLLASITESPWPDAKLESVQARLFDNGLRSLPTVLVTSGAVLARRSDGGHVSFRECHVSVFERAGDGKNVAGYLEALAEAVAMRTGEAIPVEGEPSSERGRASWRWISDGADRERPVRRSVAYVYGPVGRNLSSMISFESYGEVP